MSSYKSLKGLKFGKLLVLDDDPIRTGKSKTLTWNCKCECGRVKYITGSNLKYGTVTSCGQPPCCNHVTNKTHGFSTGGKLNPIYRAWLGMKARCSSKRPRDFKYYGGRGIKVCDEWVNDPVAFYNWSIANGWQEGLSLDRIDVNGNYEPSNCRWADVITQANNKTNTIKVRYKGEILTSNDINCRFGISRGSVTWAHNLDGTRGVNKLIKNYLNKVNHYVKSFKTIHKDENLFILTVDGTDLEQFKNLLKTIKHKIL